MCLAHGQSAEISGIKAAHETSVAAEAKFREEARAKEQTMIQDAQEKRDEFDKALGEGMGTTGSDRMVNDPAISDIDVLMDLSLDALLWLLFAVMS